MAPIALLASIFQPNEIADQLTATFDLGESICCEFYRQGINDTYRVDTAVQQYYLRVYRHGWRTHEQVAAETDLLTRLAAEGLSVSAPVAARTGEMVHVWDAPEGARLAVLFTAAPGELAKDTAVSQSHALGQLTARLHNLTDQWELDYPRPAFDAAYFLHEPIAHIQAVFGQRQQDMSLIRRLADKLGCWLEAQPCAAPFSGLCHGDLHPENVHFTADGQATLFDFDCFGYGCRAYDLATFLWSRYLFASSDQKRQRTWMAFLDGYEQERPLPLDTLPAVLRFVVLRQIWVMGMHTGPFTQQYGRRWLNEKYVDKHFGLLNRLVADFKLL